MIFSNKAYFKEIMLNLAADASEQEVDILMSIARDVRKYPGRCGSQTIAGASDVQELDFEVNYARLKY